MNERIEYYDIEASDTGTLLLELESEVPARHDGTIYHGYTFSEVRWQWQLRQRSGRCRVYKAEAEVDIVMTLPRLLRTRPGSEVEQIWQQWYPALRRHEQQHANNAVQIARRGETRLLALPPRKNCDQLAADAQALSAAMLAKLRKINTDYDRRTRHGETEGAALGRYIPVRDDPARQAQKERN